MVNDDVGKTKHLPSLLDSYEIRPLPVDDLTLGDIERPNLSG